MGYVPGSVAQGLRTRTTKLFGVVISSLANPIFARVVLAIEERAHEPGYEIFLCHTLNSPEREEVCLRRLLSRRVDGLFISPVYRMERDAPVYRELLAYGTPVVLLGHPAPFCSAFASVSTDDLWRELPDDPAFARPRPQAHRLLDRTPGRAMGPRTVRRLPAGAPRSRPGRGRPAGVSTPAARSKTAPKAACNC